MIAQYRTSLGGLESGPATPSSGTRTPGPALGGILAIPLHMKIAGAGSYATVDGLNTLTASRLFAAIYHVFFGGAPVDVGIQTPSGFTLIPAPGSFVTAGSFVAHKEGSGVTASDRAWSTGVSEEALRSIPRDTVLKLIENGAAAPAFGAAVTCLVAVRGPAYDADNPTAGSTNKDPLYFSSND